MIGYHIYPVFEELKVLVVEGDFDYDEGMNVYW